MNEQIIHEGAGYKYTFNGNYIKVYKSDVHSYTIMLDEQELLICSCPGFKYHNGNCKHITTILPILKTINWFEEEDNNRKERLEKFELNTLIEILIQTGYRTMKDKNIMLAKKWVQDKFKQRPTRPWINSMPISSYVNFINSLRKEVGV